MFSRTGTIFLIGVWVAVLPFLGFPNLWRKFLFIATGLGLAYLSYRLNKDISLLPKVPECEHSKSYVENKDSVNQL